MSLSISTFDAEMEWDSNFPLGDFLGAAGLLHLPHLILFVLQ